MAYDGIVQATEKKGRLRQETGGGLGSSDNSHRMDVKTKEINCVSGRTQEAQKWGLVRARTKNRKKASGGKTFLPWEGGGGRAEGGCSLCLLAKKKVLSKKRSMLHNRRGFNREGSRTMLLMGGEGKSF